MSDSLLRIGRYAGVSFLTGFGIGALAPLIYLGRFNLIQFLGFDGALIGGILGGVTGAFFGVILYPIIRNLRPGLFWIIVVIVSYTACIKSAFDTSYQTGPVPLLKAGIKSVVFVSALYLPVGLLLRWNTPKKTQESMFPAVPIARIALIVIILAIGFFFAREGWWFAQNWYYESLIVETRKELSLGQDYESVASVVRKKGWNSDQVDMPDDELLVLRSPPYYRKQFRNWQLNLGFQENKLISIKVRTAQGQNDKPPDSPPDIESDDLYTTS